MPVYPNSLQTLFTNGIFLLTLNLVSFFSNDWHWLGKFLKFGQKIITSCFKLSKIYCCCQAAYKLLTYFISFLVVYIMKLFKPEIYIKMYFFLLLRLCWNVIDTDYIKIFKTTWLCYLSSFPYSKLHITHWQILTWLVVAWCHIWICVCRDASPILSSVAWSTLHLMAVVHQWHTGKTSVWLYFVSTISQ